MPHKLAPEDGLTLACIGYCCNLLGGTSEARAVKSYQDAIKAGFHTAEVANNLGCSLRMQGLADQALPYLDQAASMNPNLQAAFHNCARVRLEGTA